MAKGDREMTLFDQAKVWWESDTAKAIATIVAVLLIPASVLAWNYATNRQPDIADEGASVTEGDQQTGDSQNAENSDQTATTPTEGNNQTNGQGSAMDGENKPAPTPSEIGGVGVATLPNTSSEQDYIVQKGDSVYSISQNVCGNDSFYLSNLRENYLRVGSTIKVTCE